MTNKKLPLTINVAISKLKPAKYNPRKISKEMMDKLIASIKEFGIAEPLVVNKDYTVIGGHQRLYAAQKLGYKEVPCVCLTLDAKREKVLNLALNKIQGEWDFTLLADMLIDLDTGDLDMSLTGFDEPELEQIATFSKTGLEAEEFESEVEAAAGKKGFWVWCEFDTQKDMEKVAAAFGTEGSKQLDAGRLLKAAKKFGGDR